MRRLKRDEARALMLKAEGLSYVEIADRLGWTYTNVNKHLTKARARVRLTRLRGTSSPREQGAPQKGSTQRGPTSAESALQE